MFWTYIFPFSFAFPPVPLVRYLLLFFLATGIRVFPVSLSLITDPAVLKKDQQSLSFAVADEETV
jgi:hypothetical protein